MFKTGFGSTPVETEAVVAYVGGRFRRRVSVAVETIQRAVTPRSIAAVPARKAGLPIFYTTRHADTDGVRSTHRRMDQEAEELYHIKEEVAPMPGELVVYKERASGFFGTPLVAHLRKVGPGASALVPVTDRLQN